MGVATGIMGVLDSILAFLERRQEAKLDHEKLMSTCVGCENLARLLEQEKAEKEILLKALTRVPEKQIDTVRHDYRPINTRTFIPSSVRRQQLENASRKKSKELKLAKETEQNKAKSTEQLERELLGEDDANQESETISNDAGRSE
jgi:hypothetical protein